MYEVDVKNSFRDIFYFRNSCLASVFTNEKKKIQQFKTLVVSTKPKEAGMVIM